MDLERPDVMEVFLRTLRESPAERPAFLGAMRLDDAVLRRVEALLRAHDGAGDFLEGPAFRVTSTPWANSGCGAPGGGATSNCPDPTDALGPLAFLARSESPGRLGLLAHYEVLNLLGVGGMGIVLRGLDTKLNRVVAIKVLVPRLAADAESRRRFLREAQAAAAVRHPHVVAIHAVDECNGIPYMVCEYIDGNSLQQRLDDRGALPLVQALRIGTQVASGLAAAHTQGLVHRDIKPGNILLEGSGGRAKIADFGLARVVDDVQITQAGAVYGTPLYMSPEQARGGRVDQRSDLFSLGSVLYSMCAGRPPFGGDTGLVVLRQVCEDTPRPIREVAPHVPEWLGGIIAKLHAKDPGDRFASAQQVADLLQGCSSEWQRCGRVELPIAGLEAPPGSSPASTAATNLECPPRTAVRSSRRRRPGVLAAAALACLLGLALAESVGVTDLRGTLRPQLAAGRARTVAGEVRDPGGRDDARTAATPADAGRGADRRDPSPKSSAGAAGRPVKVFILAGDSNMSGRPLSRLLKSNPARAREDFGHLIRDGGWAIRDDVWIKNFERKGNLTVGFGQTPERIGPELEFGQVVGNFFEEPVLLIKTAWGGQRLNAEFRSPSMGPAPEDVLEEIRQDVRKGNPDASPAETEVRCGALYREMLAEVRQTLKDLGKLFPAYRGQGFELAGFVWFSGWNDMVHPSYCYGYSSHLAGLIRDVRSELGAPGLPFVIGQMGVHGGEHLNERARDFRMQQAAVADLPEFAGNVALVATDPFWDREALAVYRKGWESHLGEWNLYGSDFPYHYLGSARTIVLIGRAFGEAMIGLIHHPDGR